jgi:hypothetical protein
MEIASRFADGEAAYHNKRARSPKRDRSSRYNNQRRTSRYDDGHNLRNQVAAGYRRSGEEGSERKNSGYRRRDDLGGEISRNFDPSPADILNGPCHIHYTYLDGKRFSNHPMRDCWMFMKLQEAVEFSQAEKPVSIAYGEPPPPPYNKDIVNQGYLKQSNEGYPRSKIYIAAMIQQSQSLKRSKKAYPGK